jgi:hypothetical protein
MAHESHDYKATAAKLRQLARQVQSDYCRAPTNGAGVRPAREARRGVAGRTERGLAISQGLKLPR